MGVCTCMCMCMCMDVDVCSSVCGLEEANQSEISNTNKAR
jgi:hypothetical protein